MLETQERTNADGYNEVIVGSARWDQNLPDAIEAIVYVSGGSGRDKARQVHDDFLAFFERTADEVPLVRYDPLDVAQPFLEAR